MTNLKQQLQAEAQTLSPLFNTALHHRIMQKVRQEAAINPAENAIKMTHMQWWRPLSAVATLGLVVWGAWQMQPKPEVRSEGISFTELTETLTQSADPLRNHLSNQLDKAFAPYTSLKQDSVRFAKYLLDQVPTFDAKPVTPENQGILPVRSCTNRLT